jgi:tellurite resistance protein
MEDITKDIRRAREDRYFHKLEQQRLERLRRHSARETQTSRLMEAFGIRERELVRELEEAGFDIHTFRLLYLVPLIQVAWSDGGVSQRESAEILEIARVHGIEAGSAAHQCLAAWLTERPSDRFFELCLRSIRAMLRHRPASEARTLGGNLVGYSIRIASASGGFLRLRSRISKEEERLLARLAAELDERNHAAVAQVTRELER